MGWRDRDWAKFNDDERRALYGGGKGGLPPGAGGSGSTASPGRSNRGVSRRRQRIGEWTLALLVAAGVLAFALDHARSPNSVRSLTLSPVSPLSTAVPKVRTVTVAPPVDLVSVRWRTRDLAPAANAGRICLTDRRHGRICASYVVGERPADTLTRQIERLGLRVESSG